jgi:hypothetical protein
MPPTQPTWMTGAGVNRTLKTTSCAPDNCIPMIDASTLTTRFNSPSLGVAGTGTRTQFLAYGITPTSQLPGFVPGSAPDYVDQPLIIPFLTSTTIDSLITLADPMKPPTAQLPHERAIMARASTARVVDGATLTTSCQAITTTFSGQLPFDAPLAKSIELGSIDLSTADGLMLDASSQATTLTWQNDVASNGDDYVVTLFEITANRLAPLRIYHVLARSVDIDASLLASGHEYVFSITSRTGFKKAQQGDYSVDAVRFPFGEATTFGAAFQIKP